MKDDCDLHAAEQPSCRILVVDDDACLCRMSAQSLARSGYQVDMFSDGAEAWEALQMRAYNLLVTDNCMPRLTGVELIKKVRSAHMPLPVILVSGLMPTDELERHPELNLDATLQKPFTCDKLLRTVETVLHASDTTHSQLGPQPDGGSQPQAGRLWP